jgi:tRNA (guanine-N7-)-methyltransferase
MPYDMKYNSDKPHFFGRRKGKRISDSREKLFDALLPKLLISVPENGEQIDLSSLYSFKVSEYRLEIGFGGGEHLAAQSLKHKDIGFIGAEVFINGVASLVAHLAGAHDNSNKAERGTLASDRSDNVRIFNDDVRLLFSSFPDGEMSVIYVLFPDPWPKKRHAYRRFIGPENIPHLARLLKEGGILQVASDDMNYIRWSLEHLCKSPYFTWTAEKANDWRNPPSDWCPTRYEQKALAAGRKPIYLRFKRTNIAV